MTRVGKNAVPGKGVVVRRGRACGFAENSETTPIPGLRLPSGGNGGASAEISETTSRTGAAIIRGRASLQGAPWYKMPRPRPPWACRRKQLAPTMDI
jgi:hypothetical protein